MASVTINGVNYTNKCQMGMVIQERLNEELDSITITLNDVPKTTFEPFTRALIVSADGIYHYMCVNTYMESLFSPEGDRTYTYQINLISQAKLLERVILPNLKVRNATTGSKRSIYWFLKNVVLVYVINQFPYFTIGNKIKALTENVTMPEMEWHNASAKKVINDLLQVIPNNPCVVRVLGGVIESLSIATKGQNLESYQDIKIIDPNDFKQMGDYTNEVVYNVNSLLSSEPSTSLICSPRTAGDIYLTTSNSELILPSPIEELGKVRTQATFHYNDANGNSQSSTQWVNITNRIIEESQYKALYASWTNEEKASYIYFTRGSNRISGFNETTKYLYITGNDAYKNVVVASIQAEHPSWTNIGCDTSVRTAIFEINYLAIGSLRYHAIKDEDTSQNITIQEGQNTSTIDFKAFNKATKENANRLGNETKKLSAICQLNAIPKLGDYYHEDYIVSEREISFYNDFAMVNFTLNKNFIKRNIYYGIKARTQYTNIAQTNESVTREEHNKHRVIFYVSNYKSEIYNDSGVSANQFVKYYSTEGHSQKQINLFFIKTDVMSSYANIIASTYAGTRTLLVTAQCDDNYNIGTRLNDSDTILGTRTEIKYTKYVDSNGECSSVIYKGYSGFDTNRITIENIKRLPLSTVDGLSIGKDLMFSNSFIYKKNNAETLKITDQWDFVSEDDQIVIGDQIARTNVLSPTQIGAGNSQLDYCKWVYSTTAIMDKNYPTIDSSFQDVSANLFPYMVQSGTTLNIDLNGRVNRTTTKCLALINSTNKDVVLALNNVNGTLPNYFKIIVTKN